MTAVPSRSLVGWLAGGTLAALGVLVFPDAWLLLVAFDLVLAAAAALDRLLTPSPNALHAERLTPDRISVGSAQPVVLRVRNESRAALRVRLRDTIPDGFQVDMAEVGGTVPAAGEAQWEYVVKPKTRGEFVWGAIHLRYRSLLGLWEKRQTVAGDARSRVYPNLLELSRYQLLAKANRLETLGIRKVRLRGSAWEFESLRDYARGDDVRLIDWKATARRRKMIVRNHEAERNQTVLLLVDCGRLMNAEVAGLTKLDHAVNAALILGHVALGRGDRVGLCTFSRTVHGWVVPRGRKGQMRLLLEELYRLRGDFTESDHARCLRLVSARHGKRALVVILTDFVDAETAADMVAHLRLAARRYVVLFAALKDPLLEAAARVHPAETVEGFRKAAAVELLRERRQVLEQLRQAGTHVLDVEPSGLTPPLINRYLEIAYRGLL